MHTIISFSQLLSSVSDSQKGLKNATGLVKDIETLLNHDNIENLKSKVQGVIAFLAFSGEDTPELSSYVANGQLSSITTESILMLYTINKRVPSAEMVEDEVLKGLFEFDFTRNLHQEIFSNYFKENQFFALPGILVFDKIKNSKDCIYIPLIQEKSQSVLENLKACITILQDAAHKHPKVLLSRIGISLSKIDFLYFKSTSLSLTECVIKLYHLVFKFKGEIISILT